MQGVQQLAGTMNGPLNSNLKNALVQGFPSGTTVSEVRAKVLTDYDPNNIQPLPVPQKDTIVITNEDTEKNRCLLTSTGAFVDCINAGLDGYRVDNIAIDPNKKWVTFAGVPSDAEFFSTNATYTCPLKETGIVDVGKCRVTSISGSQDYFSQTLYDTFARRVWFDVFGSDFNGNFRKFANAVPFKGPSKLVNALAQEANFVAEGFSSYRYLKTCEIESNGDYKNCQMSEMADDFSFPFFITGGPDASGFYLLNQTFDNSTFSFKGRVSYCSNSLLLPCPVVTGIPYEEDDEILIYDILFLSSKVAYVAAGNITSFETVALQRCSVKSPTEFTDCAIVETPFEKTDTFIELISSANDVSNVYVLSLPIKSNMTSLNVCDVDSAGDLGNCKLGYSDLFGAVFSEPVVF